MSHLATEISRNGAQRCPAQLMCQGLSASRIPSGAMSLRADAADFVSQCIRADFLQLHPAALEDAAALTGQHIIDRLLALVLDRPRPLSQRYG